MKNTYRNSIRSEEMIKNAFVKLVTKKNDINDITVSDIVKVANINRGTFYNHYNNVMEVVEEFENELLDELTKSFEKNSSQKDFAGFINTILEYFKANEIFYRKIVKSISQSVIDNLKIKFIVQITKLQAGIDETKLIFMVNGIAGVYIDYLMDRTHLTLEEIAKQSIVIINELLGIEKI